MEIELKLKISNEEDYKRLLCNIETIDKLSQPVKIHMRAEYMDTKSSILSKNKIALRVRSEDDKKILTVKSNGIQINGLHKREEINVELDNENMDLTNILKTLDIGNKIIKLSEKEKLNTIIITDFERIKFIVSLFGCEAEIAIDKGFIIANGKTDDIMELEIEYISGDIDNLKNIGDFFISNYNLEPEPRSKFERGLMLT